MFFIWTSEWLTLALEFAKEAKENSTDQNLIRNSRKYFFQTYLHDH